MDLDDAPPAELVGRSRRIAWRLLSAAQKSLLAGRNCRNLEGIQGRPEEQAASQSAGRAVSAAGEVQRRADLVAAAGRRGAGRPDLGRRVRPDGRDQRVRPDARREVRDVLRAAYSRRDARRAAHDGLGAAAGAQQGQQAERGGQDAGGQERPLAQRERAGRSTWASASPSSRR